MTTSFGRQPAEARLVLVRGTTRLHRADQAYGHCGGSYPVRTGADINKHEGKPKQEDNGGRLTVVQNS